MKNLLIILLSLSSITNLCSAQDDNRIDYRDRILFGYKLGANYSNIYDSKGGAYNTDPKFGLATGGFLAIPIGKFLGIQPEILFSQKGFQANGSILGSTFNFTRTTNFIDVPLLFAIKPAGFLTILAGPQYSYLMKQKDVFKNAGMSIEQQSIFTNNNIRQNILGFVLGTDITIKHIVLGARAAWDLQNNKGDGTSTDPRYKNVLYQATIGYRFYNN